METDDEPTQLRYAHALAAWGDAGGYDAEVLWDTVHASPRSACRSSGRSAARCARCPAASRSGWRSRRCCAGPTRCCCSTSRTTTSTCRASAGWRTGCGRRRKTVLFVSHDRELLAQRPRRRSSRSRRSGVGARRRLRHLARGPATTGIDRLDELHRRWDEEHDRLKELVRTLQRQAAHQRRDGVALPGDADPAARGSRRPGRRRSGRATQKVTHAPARRAHRRAGASSARTSS